MGGKEIMDFGSILQFLKLIGRGVKKAGKYADDFLGESPAERAGMSEKQYQDLLTQQEQLRKYGVKEKELGIKEQETAQMIQEAGLPPALENKVWKQPKEFGTDYNVRPTGIMDPGGGGEFMGYFEPGTKPTARTQSQQIRDLLMVQDAFKAQSKIRDQVTAEAGIGLSKARIEQSKVANDIARGNLQERKRQYDESVKRMEDARKEEAEAKGDNKFLEVHKAALTMMPEGVAPQSPEWWRIYIPTMHHLANRMGVDITSYPGQSQAPPLEDPILRESLTQHGLLETAEKQGEFSGAMEELVRQLTLDQVPQEEWPPSLLAFIDDIIRRQEVEQQGQGLQQ
jgi:hypothetical protein